MGNNFGAWLALVFVCYSSITLIAIMNIVTGLFVTSAISSAEEDSKKVLLKQMQDLFKEADLDESNTITWNEFVECMHREEMQAFLKAVDLDEQDARALFHLLDIDDSGEIDIDELLNGCLRIHGSAKAIELAAFIHEYRKMAVQANANMEAIM